MKTLILNYYKNQILAKSTQEAIDFINSLQGITANSYTISVLEDYFSSINGSKIQDIWNKKIPFEIATTGCGSSRVFCYKPLANTLEKHNEIIAASKAEQKAKDEIKQQQRMQEFLEYMHEPLKGWYIVTITGLAFKLRGNDGKVTKSVRVFAENRNEAYNKASEFLQENPPKNVMNFYSFESPQSTLFEYVGTWTDEAELEYQ